MENRKYHGGISVGKAAKSKPSSWGKMFIQKELRLGIQPQHPQILSSLGPMSSPETLAFPKTQTCQIHPTGHFLGPKLKY